MCLDIIKINATLEFALLSLSFYFFSSILYFYFIFLYYFTFTLFFEKNQAGSFIQICGIIDGSHFVEILQMFLFSGIMPIL